MTSIQACSLPDQALLGEYARDGAFTDCYMTEVIRPVTQAEYVEAFYTGAIFKLERRLLAWFAARPSTDAEAKALADGALEHFSAWRVEARSADQLLLCDDSGRTRSWLMVAPFGAGGTASTRLYFGSAVVASRRRSAGQPRIGFTFSALLGFHKLYSRVLLQAAAARLARGAGTRA